MCEFIEFQYFVISLYFCLNHVSSFSYFLHNLAQFAAAWNVEDDNVNELGQEVYVPEKRTSPQLLTKNIALSDSWLKILNLAQSVDVRIFTKDIVHAFASIAFLCIRLALFRRACRVMDMEQALHVACASMLFCFLSKVQDGGGTRQSLQPIFQRKGLLEFVLAWADRVGVFVAG